MLNLLGIIIIVLLYLIYSSLRDILNSGDRYLRDILNSGDRYLGDKIRDDLLQKLLNKIDDIEGHLININGNIEDIESELSDFVGKANFKWGFSEHYPGEK